MQRIWTILMVLFLGVTLAGCAASKKKGGTVEVEDATIGGTGAEVITDASASAVDSDDATAGEIITIDQDDADMDDPLGRRVVYFDFDSSNLTPEAQRVVEAHAQYLFNNPGMAVVLEGHADERGTREYNLALGERRAAAARDYLLAQGVDPARIKVISYGKERPAMAGSNEESWAKNRRAATVLN